MWSDSWYCLGWRRCLCKGACIKKDSNLAAFLTHQAKISSHSSIFIVSRPFFPIPFYNLPFYTLQPSLLLPSLSVCLHFHLTTSIFFPFLSFTCLFHYSSTFLLVFPSAIPSPPFSFRHMTTAVAPAIPNLPSFLPSFLPLHFPLPLSSSIFYP